MYYWHDKHGFIWIDDEDFMDIWRLLHKVWMSPYRGALAFGCGRDTMSYTVYRVTGEWVSKNLLRLILECGVIREWVIPNRVGGGYKCFNLRPIRYERLL